jgi:hypothetical protein
MMRKCMGTVMYHLLVVVSACDPKDLFVKHVTM